MLISHVSSTKAQLVLLNCWMKIFLYNGRHYFCLVYAFLYSSRRSLLGVSSPESRWYPHSQLEQRKMSKPDTTQHRWLASQKIAITGKNQEMIWNNVSILFFATFVGGNIISDKNQRMLQLEISDYCLGDGDGVWRVSSSIIPTNSILQHSDWDTTRPPPAPARYNLSLSHHQWLDTTGHWLGQAPLSV